MPIAVKELENQRSKDEFYGKPIKEKILLFLQKNKEQGFSIFELMNNLEKYSLPKGNDIISSFIILGYASAYSQELTSLKKDGKIMSYNYKGIEYYYCKDGGYW